MRNFDYTDDGGTKPKVFEINLPEDSGTFRLELQLNVAADLHLNADAPSTWKLTLPPGWGNQPELKGHIDCDNLLCFDIQYNFNVESNSNENKLVKITIKAYLCNDNDGTCSCSQNTWIITCRKVKETLSVSIP